MRALKMVLLLLTSACACAHAQPARDVFRVQDVLGRTWHNEVVRFDLTDSGLSSARAGRALVGPDGRALAYQLIGDKTPAIAFATDLAAFESREYRFTTAGAAPATDLRVEEDADSIRITNALIGIAVSKRLTGGAGPLKGIRLGSGRWVGRSLLKAPVSGTYTAQVVSRGPVTAEVLCRVLVGPRQQWTLRLRIDANEPVVLVDETFSLGSGASFELDLSEGFQPDSVFYRYGRSAADDANSVGRVATWKIQPDAQPVFVLEPWLHWWEKQRQGTWFGLYRENERDLLAIGAREPAVWVDPAKPAAARASAQVPLTLARNTLNLALPLNAGARKWMISAHDKDAALAPLKRGNLKHAPTPQQYLIKHGDFPLDVVRRYTLAWPADDTDRPRLLVRRADLARVRARVRIEEGRLAQLRKATLSQYDLEDAVPYYLATGDRDLGKNIAATAARWLQDSVDMLMQQNYQPTIGFAPHQQIQILNAVNLADAIWSSEHVSPATRSRLKAQLAFLGYTVNRDDYWSPARGFGANPNMTSTVAAFQTAIGAMIREHPMAAQWVANGMKELKENQLDHWADDNGGWLEAPHYAVLSYDYLIGAFLMTHNAGFNDHLFDPKMKKVIEWLAKISTPPDSAAAGTRFLPPIGNTYMREPSGEFGIVAALWRDKDPRFASEMQWMYRQHGAFAAAGVGGLFPMLAGYRQLLIDPSIPEKPPAYTSELFPRTGVVLRNGFASDRETQLHLIAGSNHAHYDRDSGSITLWGKGRLIANDFGYYGEAPADDHSMLTSPAVPDAAPMNVVNFARGDPVDYVRGLKSDVWERAIIFMKGAALEPSYFVVSDSLRRPAPANWRLWLTAQELSTGRQSALARGRQDVDTDVFFMRPAQAGLSTEARTRDTYGTTAGKYGRVSTSQTALTVKLAPGETLAAVIYPRLKTEQPPQFESIAQGKAVKVATAGGTDYVFAAATPFVYSDDGIRFEGTFGAVRFRADGPILWLGEAGSITARGKTLRRDNDVPAPR
jgi:hypothetical protein